MSDVLSAALFPDSLSDAERAEVQRRLREDATARRQYRAAQALQTRLADDLNIALPDRSLLVCDALAQCGRGDALTEEERRRLAEERSRLADVYVAHPALADVTQQVAREAAAFEGCWVERIVHPRERVQRPPQRRSGTRRWAWRTGVALAVTAFAAATFLLVQRDAAYTTVEVAPGEVRHLTLADGSHVKLMGGSRLAFSDPGKDALFNRQVRLSGDAYFDVQPGAQRFIVHTGEADVTVLGTQFGIRAGAAATEVTLVAGSVLLAPSGAPARGVMLAPGQQSRMARGAQVPSAPAAVEPDEVLAWTGLFFFRDTPLADIAARLTDGLGVTVEVAPALAPEAVTGTFDREQGAEEIVRTLATTLDASAVRTETGWRIE